MKASNSSRFIFRPLFTNFKTPTVRCAALTVMLPVLLAGRIHAESYDEINIVPADDFFDVPTPPVNDYIEIGGFQLKVDRTRWGLSLTKGNHGFLGRLEGTDVDINVSELPAPQATAIGSTTDSRANSATRVEHIFTSHAVPGLKVIHRGQRSLFGENICGIDYIFVSPENKRIRFAAHAKVSHPDWSDANRLVLNTLSLAARHH